MDGIGGSLRVLQGRAPFFGERGSGRNEGDLGTFLQASGGFRPFSPNPSRNERSLGEGPVETDPIQHERISGVKKGR